MACIWKLTFLLSKENEIECFVSMHHEDHLQQTSWKQTITPMWIRKHTCDSPRHTALPQERKQYALFRLLITFVTHKTLRTLHHSKTSHTCVTPHLTVCDHGNARNPSQSKIFKRLWLLRFGLQAVNMRGTHATDILFMICDHLWLRKSHKVKRINQET